MRFRLGLVSKARRFFAPSPAREKGLNGKSPVEDFALERSQVDCGFGFRSPGWGSKEETFFDSQAWFDSDYEDDFLSVNGDFTPSRGSMPNHQISTGMTSLQSKIFSDDTFPDSKFEPSPTDRKKKLADLLQETSQGEQIGTEHNAISGNIQINGKPESYKLDANQPLKSSKGTPYISGTISVGNSEPTPNRDMKHWKEKAGKSAQCCLPSLVQTLSFNERKQQRMSPGR